MQHHPELPAATSRYNGHSYNLHSTNRLASFPEQGISLVKLPLGIIRYCRQDRNLVTTATAVKRYVVYPEKLRMEMVGDNKESHLIIKFIRSSILFFARSSDFFLSFSYLTTASAIDSGLQGSNVSEGRQME